MKNWISRFLTCIAIFSSLSLNAQVFLLENSENHVIKEYLKNNNQIRLLTNDTITLPFFEDFSYTGPYPSTKYWTDDFIFVNRTFGKNAPSAGVATFDALNQNGELYPYLSQNETDADYLTSKVINLSKYKVKNNIAIETVDLYYYDAGSGLYFPSDSLWYVSGASVLSCKEDTANFTVDMFVYYLQHTPPDSFYVPANASLYYQDNGNYIAIPYYFINEYQPSDSLYFSFMYQPQGMSTNDPETGDSLVLQFRTPEKAWHTVWKTPGVPYHNFKKVMIPLSIDTTYLTDGFSFRFYNYVTTGGTTNPSWNSNCDFWNIDYLYLNKNRTAADTAYDDVTIADQRISFLGNYTTVPWAHYKFNPDLRDDTIKYVIRNLNDTMKPLSRKIIIYEYPSTPIVFPQPGNENIAAFSDSLAVLPISEDYFSSTQPDSAHFLAKAIISAGLASNNQFLGNNDTMIQHQYFNSYYAYDDGTAENGFGLGGVGTQNSKMAYRFVTQKPDTLRGIYMFFNQTVNNASQKFFYLTVWNNAAGRPAVEIYQEIGQRPEYAEGLNRFYYYPLDTPLLINDTVYIGWKQTTTDLLNIGFDANNDKKAQILYNIYGVWETIPYSGALMMRPVFSSTPYLQSETHTIKPEFNMYPNPVKDRVYFDGPEFCNDQNTRIEIYDLQGRKCKEDRMSESGIDVTELSPGMYLVRIIHPAGMNSARLIIQE